MFSSLLPNVSSSMKFAQNGPAKPSNRFSVRVFKTGPNTPYSYPVGAKQDLGYRAPPPPPPPPTQRDQQNANWYPSNSYDQRPRGTGNFAIYPSATADTFIYEQSTCSKSDIFSNSDTSSIMTFSPSSAFSPALSSDSTSTLQNTPVPERPGEDQRGTRPATPAPRSGYSHAPAAPQGAPINRTASTSHHIHEAQAESIEEHRARLTSLPGRSTTPFRVPPMPPAVSTAAMARVPSMGGYIQIPEYAASSISELEVEERDRIAKLNADYNAAASAASASFYTSNSSTPYNSPTSRDHVGRVASSQPQPLHPNLHFPVRPSESGFPAQPPFYSSTTSHSAVIHDSPPTVERISSQLPPDYQVPHPRTPSPPQHLLPTSDSRARDNAYKPEPQRMPSYRTSPQNHNDSFDGTSGPSSRSAHSTYATSAQDTTASQEYRSHRRSSVIGPRPDLGGLRPTSEVRDYGPPGPDYFPTFKSGSDSSSSTLRDHGYKDRRDAIQSPIRESGQTSPRDLSRHEPPGSDPRRDARTPAPRDSDEYSRRNSYAPEAPRSPRETGSDPRRAGPRESEDYRPHVSRRSSYAPEAPRSPKESRTQPQSTRDVREVYKPGPLSSSPTQMRPSPVDLEPVRQSGSAENDRAHERTRTRSSSFSASARPTVPVQIAPSDSRYASDYERAPRGEPDRRGDPHSSSSHYMQIPTVPLPGHESQSSQRHSPSSRAPYPEPEYQKDPSRAGRSDEARQYASSSQPSRNSPPHEQQQPAVTVKYTDAAGNVRTITSNGSEPQRRNSDGDQNPPVRPPLTGRNSAPLLRDQLWTNDGAYKSPPAGQEYPPDLDEYPENGDGWMNEECIRIDLNHRLIPKPPLRSALKQTRA
ncbi:hypothetical protein GALMADRAFT_210502 [Galerina marginata CBS 339.88]|uniref:Uncharacterized protein n=1 Tax=Galerina marginata (strain CBS 339.88) TaxID=685588 RepID=A0A067T094_GALM3|nr:hypothetical protein GALMADRAFT_210502 [Galerina marginata CBS 339.88]